MSDEYLTKEEIRQWRSSVEKITLEEYAARLGKKLQEEKKTNDLADMLYTHYNPAKSMENYNTVTKLEKIDLTAKLPVKNKNIAKDTFINNNSDLKNDEIAKKQETEEIIVEKSKNSKVLLQNSEKTNKKNIKSEKVADKTELTNIAVSVEVLSKEEASEKDKKATKEQSKSSKSEKSASKKDSTKESSYDFSSLNITFQKSLTDREEKVLAYFMEHKGEIVYAKDLAELLDLKRDYIYKYIKNLRAKMSTDIIVNADNGGFKLD